MNTKKTIAVIMALLAVLSSLFICPASCSGNPDDGPKEAFFEGFLSQDTDEIEYVFNVRYAVFPEDYTPQASVFYDGKIDKYILPEKITLVLSDGTSVEGSPDNPPVLADGKPVLIRYRTDWSEEDCCFAIEIYRWFNDTQEFSSSGYYPHAFAVVYCDKAEKSFGENISYFFSKISEFFSSFFSRLFNNSPEAVLLVP